MRKPKNESKEATTRALWAMVDDLSNLTESAERLRIQIAALAARHGVVVAMAD